MEPDTELPFALQTTIGSFHFKMVDSFPSDIFLSPPRQRSGSVRGGPGFVAGRLEGAACNRIDNIISFLAEVTLIITYSPGVRLLNFFGMANTFPLKSVTEMESAPNAAGLMSMT